MANIFKEPIMTARKGLGRGLGALISDAAPPQDPLPDAGLRKVPIDQITRNPWQPRREFEPDALHELAASIHEHGVIQPLIVRPSESDYMLIAGERRLRAATEAGLREVPVIVADVDDGQALELALIENLQRQDLNPLEEAEGYRELADQFNMTQEQIATRVGKSRAAVANALRLLNLPDEVRAFVAGGQLSVGHAKVLLGLESESMITALARRSVSDGLTVRQLAKRVERAGDAPRRPRAVKADIPQGYLSHLSDCLHRHFGTSVRISPCRTYANGKKGKGAIEIDFFSNEDLDRILQVIGLALDESV